MTSVSSRGRSPFPSPDTDEWNFLNKPGDGMSASSTIAFESPDSASMMEYAIVVSQHHASHSHAHAHAHAHSHVHAHPPTAAISPLQPDMDFEAAVLHFGTRNQQHQQQHQQQQLLLHHHHHHPPLMGHVIPSPALAPVAGQPEYINAASEALVMPHPGLSPLLGDLNNYHIPMALGNDLQPANVGFDFRPVLATENSEPWSAGRLGNNPRGGHLKEYIFLADTKLLQRPQATPSSTSSPSAPSASTTRDDAAVNKQKASRKFRQPARVKKNRPMPHPAPSSRSSQFVIMTPKTVDANAGRPNPFECFETISASQRGRKGPLAVDAKVDALQVRQLGACFVCQLRKVKCGKERPCHNCQKLAAQLPQAVCWQFRDFLPVLFPNYLRDHFRKEEMAKFMNDNFEAWVAAAPSCTVSLLTGHTFKSRLTLRGRFFVPRGSDILSQWHKRVDDSEVTLDARPSVPIGLDLENNPKGNSLRGLLRDYVESLPGEPTFVDQVTCAFTTTKVPAKVLRIVHNYAERSQSAMVRRALAIYAMHYVMTHHLCFSRQTLLELAHVAGVPQNAEWVTSRMINRQVKLVVDELMRAEMQQLFEDFTKSLKERSKREWAPCLASFLVLCLFMESVETAADTFVIMENEICLRENRAPEYKRSFALEAAEAVENLPFRQFAYQFHQVFQTHSRDANAKPFNPLVGDEHFANGELDGAARDMVLMLRALVGGESWYELDFLTTDPILGEMLAHEEHPFPREVAHDYQGRLASKFLLSFLREEHIMAKAVA